MRSSGAREGGEDEVTSSSGSNLVRGQRQHQLWMHRCKGVTHSMHMGTVRRVAAATLAALRLCCEVGICMVGWWVQYMLAGFRLPEIAAAAPGWVTQHGAGTRCLPTATDATLPSDPFPTRPPLFFLHRPLPSHYECDRARWRRCTAAQLR